MTFELRPLGIRELLDQGLGIARLHAKRLLTFQLLLYVPGTLVLSFLLDRGGTLLLGLVALRATSEVGAIVAALGGSVGVMLLMQAVLVPISAVAFTRVVLATYRGRACTFGSLVRDTWRLAPRALGISASISGLILLVFSPPLFLFTWGLQAFAASGGLSSAEAAAVVEVGVVVILGGLAGLISSVFAGYVLLRFGLAFAVLAVEELPVIPALRRASTLMQGRHLRGLGLVLVLGMIGAALASLLSLFSSAPSLKGIERQELRQILPALLEWQFVSTLLGQLATGFTTAYGSICWALFYLGARVERDGAITDASLESSSGDAPEA